MSLIELKQARRLRPLLKTPRSADMAAVAEAQMAGKGAVVVHLRALTYADSLQQAINAFNRMGQSAEECAKSLHQFRCAYEGYRK